MRSFLLTFIAGLGLILVAGCGEGPKKIVETPEVKKQNDQQHAAKSAAVKAGVDPAKAK